MKPRLIHGQHADYVPSVWQGGRAPFQPLGMAVLILCDKSAETAGKLGVIRITDDKQKTMTVATETGAIVAMGRRAFDNEEPEDRPQVGDRVVFEAYAGVIKYGRDGSVYRIMNDTCIYGLDLSDGSEDADDEVILASNNVLGPENGPC